MIIILAVIRIIPYFYRLFIPENDDLLSESIAIRKLELVETNIREKGYSRKTGKLARLFKFDPNHTSLPDWQLLGLSAKQAAVMIRYTAKGGRFYKKSDLQKMYPISREMYDRLEPYISIPAGDSLAFKKKYVPYATIKHIPVIVDINTADTVELDAVKGIGPAFARRIFRYRERLGGFYQKEQLMGIYGLDSAKYAEIKDQLRIDGHALRPIYINRVEFKDLQHHPYLNFKQVNAIIQFRKQHGNYSNIAELKKVAILPAETIDKLIPYISFDHD
ncbi:ComEA family DNA-binding protein [Pedobacter hartonius]|nr:helix-hairpin-helix domain-containing protein [Pedobacter hartonius]